MVKKIKEVTLLQRVKNSRKEFMKWPKARREAALKEANSPINYYDRMIQSGGYVEVPIDRGTNLDIKV